MASEDPRSTPRTTRLDGDGIRLVADVFGGEPGSALVPAVLLHGGGQTRHAWGSAGRSIASSGRLALSVDLRGHGDSDWSPDGLYTLDRFAADIRLVAAGLPSPPVLIGASLGGLASLVAVGEHRDQIASALVLVDVTPHVEYEGRTRIQTFMRDGMRGFDTLDQAADAIAAFNPHRPRSSNLSGLQKNLRQLSDGRWYWHWDPRFITNAEGVDGQGGLVDHDRLCRAAAQVRIPTLLVRGRMSDIVSDKSVEELQELIPHAEVVDVAGAGHMVVGDRNDRFNRAVLDFVGRVGD